jgi:hypothetical protein
MKKFTLAIAAFGLISLASCKKDYTCTCTDPADPTSNQNFTFKDVKKKDAKTACDTWNALYSIDGGKCEL